MQIKNKIRAFTLSEMLVVLLLTTIVVGIAFSVLTLVQRQMNGIQNTLEDGTRFRQLYQQLAIDINTYQKIEYKSNESRLVFTHPMDSVIYTFENTVIIRQADTFKLNLSVLKFFYEGIETNSGKVDAIEISTNKKEYQRKLFLYKLMDAETLMR